ncbi:putative bifunctional diguanylate cyclase/phosphodiesterase [Azonexus caeni]|jgi:diguanylate cyclase (GGDEF)-like protein/PAS domain S-box-containing protein|uniref:putative bifunctional diguanylate cyclase/phosphodiesterase n=1 Tax=Azonexus caeni TaxID=266126 RepID=UPI003A8953F2
MLRQQCQLLVDRGGYLSASVSLASTGGADKTEEDTRVIAHGAASPSAPALSGDAARLTLHLDEAQRLGKLLIEKSGRDFTTAERLALDIVAKNIGATLSRIRQASAGKQLESRLRQLSRALDSSLNGVMITSSTQLDHPIVYVNPAFEKITGYSASEVIGRSGRFLIGHDLQQRGLAAIREALRKRHQAHAILRNYRKDGSLFWNELFIAPVRDESGSFTTHFVSIINDVSERIGYERQLEFHANHDPLTGLANRNLLNDRIAQAIVRARSDGMMTGLLQLGLDRFRWINDSLGHASANEVLKEVAQRLRECVRDTDTVARLAGDEFVIVIGRLTTTNELAGIANKILRLVNQPIPCADREIVVTASIGAAIYPGDGEQGDTLLRHADIAMHQAKAEERNSYRFFMPTTRASVIDRLSLEGDLRHAIAHDELVVHYQPLVELSGGTIIGAEALVRWQHPQRGLIPPDEFIPLAEESGLIIDIGEQVLRQVCRDLGRWRDSGLQAGRISINLSARQFRRDGLAASIHRSLTESGIGGRQLAFEVTESVVMHDLEHTAQVLTEIRELGASISLDDFGTGYSSLAYLRRLPIDILKIDRSFVRDLHLEPDAAAIAHAVIAMAHKLGLGVVAEGVECAAQLALLREFDCEEGQGFLFSRPLPPEQYAIILKQGRLPLASPPADAPRRPSKWNTPAPRRTERSLGIGNAAP